MRIEKAVMRKSIYERGNMQCWFLVKRYYAMNFNFFEMEPHVHGEFEMMYAASGSCKVYYWEADKGMPCRILNLEISIQTGRDELRLQHLCEKSKSLQDFFRYPAAVQKGYDTTGSLHTLITQLHRQLQSMADKAEHDVLKNLLFAQLLIELGRQREQRHPAEGGSKYVRKAIMYLAEHYEREIRIQDMAKEIGISTAYLQRLFKEQTGKTLIDKMNELRIEKAKILLDTRCLPIADIAASVGFNSRQHFTYTFLKVTGCSPAIFRKHKGNYSIWSGFEEKYSERAYS